MDKFTEKKKRNQVFSRFIEGLVSESSQEAIENCNTFIMMVADKTMENQKQHKGNTCKNRFCPICAWKKARKDAMKLSVMMKAIEEAEGKQFIFLTLTAPNVPAEDLEQEIKDYNKAFQRLMQRKEVKAVVKGYARKLEITYNKDRDDYHPHFHILIAVNKSYFTDKAYYIKQDRWLELWQQVTKNPLITQVNVKKVRKNKGNEAAEIAKYAAKDSDYLHDRQVFKVYYRALKGKQLIVYSGLFKDMAKQFEDGELDQYKELDRNEYVYAVMYNWGYGEYVEKEKRLLSDEEYKKVNRLFVSEEDEIKE